MLKEENSIMKSNTQELKEDPYSKLKYSDEYLNKKKSLESALDEFKSNKVDLSYDPSTLIKKCNEIKEESSMNENEKNAFNFLNEYCQIDKDMTEFYKEHPVD
jgi:hypothetical protein